MPQEIIRKRRGMPLVPKPPLPGSLLRSDPPPQGEGWAQTAPRAVQLARKLRKNMTRYEVKLWLQLRELKEQGCRFRRQVPLKNHIVDFACMASKIVVEVDGMQHGFEQNLGADLKRDELLQKIGYVVLRFTNEEVWNNIEGVAQTILLTAQNRMNGLSS